MSEAGGRLFSQRYEFERYEAGLAEFIADPARASLDPRVYQLPMTILSLTDIRKGVCVVTFAFT